MTTAGQFRKRAQRVLLTGAVALALALPVLSPRGASAKSSFLGDFNAVYATAGTRLDSCSICHTASIPSLNSYGSAWSSNGQNFAAIENLDSDGDGWSNLEEIQSLTFPGDPGDVPTTAPPPTTTTTAPPNPTTTTIAPPPTTLPPDPGLPPLDLAIKEFDHPDSIDLTGGGSAIRTFVVHAEVEEAPPSTTINAEVHLSRNGVLYLNEVRTLSGSDEYEFEVDFTHTFTSADAPSVTWTVTVVAGGQSSAPVTGTTTVTAPATTTTTVATTTTIATTTTSSPPGTSPPGGGSTTGAAVYAASCAGCHGPAGEGGAGGPVAGTSMSHAEIVAITTDGGGGMPGFSGSLSTEEIAAVADFILGLGSSGTTTTSVGGGGGGAINGAALYGQYCAACHGPQAEGGIGGPLVGSDLGFSAQVAITANGSGSMPGFSGSLSTAEIEAIINYVASLGPGGTTTTIAPGAGPSGVSPAQHYMQFCAACHGPAGEGGIGGAIAGTDVVGNALVAVIADGVGTMPGFSGQLSDADIAALATYVEGLGASPNSATPDVGDDADAPGLVVPGGSDPDGGRFDTNDLGVHDDVISAGTAIETARPELVALAILVAMLLGAVVFGWLPINLPEVPTDSP